MTILWLNLRAGNLKVLGGFDRRTSIPVSSSLSIYTFAYVAASVFGVFLVIIGFLFFVVDMLMLPVISAWGLCLTWPTKYNQTLVVVVKIWVHVPSTCG